MFGALLLLGPGINNFDRRDGDIGNVVARVHHHDIVTGCNVVREIDHNFAPSDLRRGGMNSQK